MHKAATNMIDSVGAQSTDGGGFTLRAVEIRDAADIAEIYNHYIENTTVSFETETLSVVQMAERIGRLIDGGYPYFVVETADGRIAGYCYAHEWKERAAYSLTWETTVYLRRSMESRGLGRMLMSRLVEACRQRGCRVLIACITGDNTASRKFHESIGFVKVSDFKGVGYKFGRRLDVVDYELELLS